MGHILVVDDEEQVVKLLRKVLESAGHTVVTALSGQEALKLLRAQPFALMISDIVMAQMDGMELLKEAHKERPELTVIMLTGYPTANTATASLRYDVFDYTLKPFDVEDLLSTVEAGLAHHERQQQESAAKETGKKSKSLRGFLRDKDKEFSDDVPQQL